MINLLFAGNAGVFDGILTCMLSIFMRSKLDEPVTAYVFTMDVSRIKPSYTPVTDEQIRVLGAVAERFCPGSRVIKKDITQLYEREFGGCPNEGAYCSPYTLLRLFADVAEIKAEKLLYLDADIMFNRDIRLLYDTDVS